jgi:putative glutamine amidotransferase
MSKPVIAITARKSSERYIVNQDYIDAFHQAGASILLLVPQSKENLTDLLRLADGLCIPGGMDVDPALYHQSNLQSDPIESEIDQLDLDVIYIARELNIPIFGICRGLQIINVACGGSLIQDLPKDRIDHSYSFKNQVKDQGHPVVIEKDSILYSLFGEHIEVNTYHHQGIDRLAEGLKVVARAPDGMIEAIEALDLIAVQWHPERMVQHELFEYFVNLCQENG